VIAGRLTPTDVVAGIALFLSPGLGPQTWRKEQRDPRHDEEQQTAVVLQFFGSREDMEAGAETFAAMDPSDTPGTRASVDMCEVKFEWEAP